MACYLRECGHTVHATRGNENNGIGVPLTILSAPHGTSALVLEMGASRAGDLSLLAAIARPTVRVITCIGAAHLEGFGGSLDFVLAAKLELLEGARPDDAVVLCADDERLRSVLPQLRKAHPARVWTFSARPPAAYEPQHVWVTSSSSELLVNEKGEWRASTSFALNVRSLGRGDLRTLMRMSHAGEHLARVAATTAACAIATALIARDPAFEDDMYNTLLGGCWPSVWQPPAGRMQLRKGAHCVILDDSYNASPASYENALAAFDSIRSLRGPGSRHLAKLAVLGDMAELGESSPGLHREVLLRVVALNDVHVALCGPCMQQAWEGLGLSPDPGLPNAWDRPRAVWPSELAGWVCKHTLTQHQVRNVVVLVKGSRRMHMEKIVLALTMPNECEERVRYCHSDASAASLSLSLPLDDPDVERRCIARHTSPHALTLRASCCCSSSESLPSAARATALIHVCLAGQTLFCTSACAGMPGRILTACLTCG